MVLLIEIKQGQGIVDAIAAELARAPRRQSRQVVIISFDPEMISAAERKLPEIPQMLLIWTSEGEPVPSREAVAQAVELEAEALGVPHWGASAELLQACREAGLKLFVYTVNEPEDVERVLALGVDGIITDRPDQTSLLVGG
jgi:glycerophosphoryl diester phosphodiesterase